MRPIKFRAKSNNTKSWVYGNLIKGNNYDFIITKEDYDNVVASFDTLVCQCHPIEKDSKTIGQFTGLKDINEKEIYEGDIVHCWDTIAKCEIWAVVEFGNPNAEYTWGWQLRKIKGSKGINLDILCWVECEETNAYCEVIGNIFDNPELLGEQQ